LLTILHPRLDLGRREIVGPPRLGDRRLALDDFEDPRCSASRSIA
jgi:hypothetical protein